jgi:hypothetical protein
VLETYGGRPGHDGRDGRSDRRHLFAAIFSSPCPERKDMPMLGRDLRREERLLPRTRVWVDQVGAVAYMSEGGFACHPPMLWHDLSCIET